MKKLLCNNIDVVVAQQVMGNKDYLAKNVADCRPLTGLKLKKALRSQWDHNEKKPFFPD